MTRRILQSIKLDKIACVDFPCQEAATVRLLKRDMRKAYEEARHPRGEHGRWAAAAESSKRAFYHAKAAHAAIRRAAAATDTHAAINHISDAAHSTHEMMQHARYVRQLGHRTGRELAQMLSTLLRLRGRFGKRALTYPKEQPMNITDLDRLTAQCDDLIHKIDRCLKTKRSYTFTHEDGVDDNSTVDDKWSVAADSNADLEDDDEEDGEDMGKASINQFVRTNDTGDRPGSLSSEDHPANRHRFEAMVLHLQNSESLPRDEATRQARLRFPDIWASYQKHTGSMDKAAPSFEQMVRAEAMAKGCTPTIAGQRLLYAHGGSILDRSARIAKAADAEADFIAKADAIYEQSGGTISRCQSLQLARKAAPAAFGRLQRA
jgi:hypothetical protein